MNTKLVLTSQQKEFFAFVRDKHRNQVRKYTGEPYYTHLENVALLCQRYITDPHHIEIALGHDLLEDTDCTFTDLGEALGYAGYSVKEARYIAEGIVFLTDQYTKEKYPDLNRAARKALEAQRLSRMPTPIQSIKLADMIDNTKSICKHDNNFALVYLNEKRDLLNIMRGGSIDLQILCGYVWEDGMKRVLLSMAKDIAEKNNRPVEEIFVERYYGLHPDVTERYEIRSDYGDLVNLVTMYRDEILKLDAAYKQAGPVGNYAIEMFPEFPPKIPTHIQ